MRRLPIFKIMVSIVDWYENQKSNKEDSLILCVKLRNGKFAWMTEKTFLHIIDRHILAHNPENKELTGLFSDSITTVSELLAIIHTTLYFGTERMLGKIPGKRRKISYHYTSKMGQSLNSKQNLHAISVYIFENGKVETVFPEFCERGGICNLRHSSIFPMKSCFVKHFNLARSACAESQKSTLCDVCGAPLQWFSPR